MRVDDADAPLANVVHPVAVETRVRGAGPAREVLLFVEEGLLDRIELVEHSAREPVELADPTAVESPTVDAATRDER